MHLRDLIEAQPITRRAVLIGVSNVGTPLPGVERDLRRYRSFLESDCGGAWEAYEITTLLNPSRAAISTELARHRDIDYLFTMVAGHGHHRVSLQETELQIAADEMLPISALEVFCKRQVMLVDVCRDLYDDRHLKIATESAMVKSMLESAGRSRAAYRRAYDAALRSTSEGRMKYYSCDINQSAADDGSGGLYSKAMLELAEGATKTVNIMQAHDFVCREFAENEVIQRPQAEVGRRMTFPPFVIRL